MIISTGGTIASCDAGRGAAPDAEKAASAAAVAVGYFNGRGIACETEAAFGSAGLDSSDFSPGEWFTLTRMIKDAKKRGFHKFMIIHGTDTMAYTAAWLSITVQCVSVVLTGSQRTPDEAGFDGTANILGAAGLLCEMEYGVNIYFAGSVFAGAFVHKENSEALDAYVRTGAGCIEALDSIPAFLEDWRKVSKWLKLICIHPAVAAEFPSGARLLVIEGYGAGNMPERLHREVEQAYRGTAKPVIIAASSCSLGRKSPSRYGGVGIAGLAGKGFAVFGQGSYSLEFIIALSYLALSADPENPGNTLALYLEKY